MPDRTTGENKMSKLLDLMKKLGSDAALAAEYDKDAERVMQRAGLSDEERRAMVAKDYTAIKKLTGLEDGQFATNHTIKAYDEEPSTPPSDTWACSGRLPSRCCCWCLLVRRPGWPSRRPRPRSPRMCPQPLRRRARRAS